MTTNIISNTPDDQKNEWRTPPEVFAWAAKLVGGIDFDTACTEENALVMPIWRNTGFGKKDALASDWRGCCWCNPPYNKIEPWIEKALVSDAITAMLIPSPNGEDRFYELLASSHEIAIVGRIAFLAGGDFIIKGKNGKPDKMIKKGEPVPGNTRGSSLFIINGYGKGSRSTVRRDWIFERFSGAL